MLLKKCSNKNCNQANPQPIENFNLRNSNSKQLRSWCKKCENAMNTSYYNENKEKLIANNKLYYKNHIEKMHDRNRVQKRSVQGRFKRGVDSAKKRNLSWNITLEQWQNLIIDNKCHYCNGALPETGCGLDRTNNNLGYMIGNVVPCCTDCNTLKSNIFTYEEFSELSKTELFKKILNRLSESRRNNEAKRAS